MPTVTDSAPVAPLENLLNAISTAGNSADSTLDTRIDALEALTALFYETGDFKPTGRTTASAGWLICDGSAVSRSTYANLFTVFSTRYGAGNGSTTFNLPDFRRASLVGAIALQSLGTATFNSTTDVVTVSGHGLARGQKVQFTNSGGAVPTGLTASTNYFVISTTTNSFQVSTTKNGSAVNFTSNGTGTTTAWDANFVLGTSGGGTTITQSRNEVGQHSHGLEMGRAGGPDGARASYNDTNASQFTSGGGTATYPVIPNTDGGIQMDQMPPYNAVNWLVRT